MKRLHVVVLAIVFVCLSASWAQAQGTVTWSSGYPKAGTTSGTIVVQGTASPDSGWTTGSGTVTFWPQGSGVAVTANLMIDMSGNWSLTIVNLTPGATYNLDVQVSFANQQMMTMATVSPDPATATAKP